MSGPSDESREAFPNLERLCSECEGKGGWTDELNGWVYDCSRCDGTGYELTEFGNHLMAFIRRAATRLQRGVPTVPR